MTRAARRTTTREEPSRRVNLGLSHQVAALGEATADLLAEARLPEPLYRSLRAEFYEFCPKVLEFYQRLERALEEARRRPVVTPGGWAEEAWARRKKAWAGPVKGASDNAEVTVIE